jgi:hypothetical protein
MFHHRRFAPALALVLALAAAAPAYARPGPDPQAATAPTASASGPVSPNLCSEVCGAGGYNAATGAALAHDPRPRSVALAGDASAGATLPHDPRARSVALAGGASASGSVPIRSEVVSGGGYGNPAAPATLVRVVHHDNGFDWGDAGIGAGSAIALMLLLGAAALSAGGVRRRGAAVNSDGVLGHEPDSVLQLSQ